MPSPSADRLFTILDTFPRVLIAFSGGVDSACLLYAAHLHLGTRATGILADSPSLPREELRGALLWARQIGIAIEVIHTHEFENLNYLSNPPNRCFFCKSSLFEQMEMLALRRGVPILAYGENADDLSTLRPGSRAAAQFQVRAPLKEAGLTKADVRALSAAWNLSTADKPASPCLSSRIPHGTPVTQKALRQIEKGETAIRALGFRVFRLRHHGLQASLEFAPDELARAQSHFLQEQIAKAVTLAGYETFVINPRGYRAPIDKS